MNIQDLLEFKRISTGELLNDIEYLELQTNIIISHIQNLINNDNTFELMQHIKQGLCDDIFGDFVLKLLEQEYHPDDEKMEVEKGDKIYTFDNYRHLCQMILFCSINAFCIIFDDIIRG